MHVIASLRESLDQLDEVLEMLEEAERQKTADEREIDALRQQLRRFQRPPEEIQRHRPPGRQGESHRPHRDQRGRHRDQREARGSQDSHKPHGAHREHAPPSESTAGAAAGNPSAEENPPTPHGSDLGGPS
jgi:hypothetical protein